MRNCNYKIKKILQVLNWGITITKVRNCNCKINKILQVLKWGIAITKLTKSCEYNIEKSQFHTFSKIQMRQILSSAQANRTCSESKHPKNNGWCVEWFRLMFDDASNDLALCSRLKFGHSAPWHRDDIARLDDIWKP